MEVALLILAVWGFFPVLADDKFPIDLSFDIKRFYGKWYPIITANRYRPYLERPYFAFTARASPNQHDSLDINLEIPRDGTCRVRTTVLEPSGFGSYESKDSQVIFYIVETDNDNHVIWHVKKGNEVLLQLLAKKKEAALAWHTKLFYYARLLEYSPEKFSYLRESDLCTDTMPRVAFRP